MRKEWKWSMAALSVACVLGGCVSSGEVYRPDIYDASGVNQAQEVQTVQIIAVIPAKVAVRNTKGHEQSQVVGAVLGALVGAAIGGQSHHHDNRIWGGIAGGLAGSAVGGAIAEESTIVQGVQITFRHRDKIFNSVQVGQVCEYKLGTAIMVSPSPNATRIQPNNQGGCAAPMN